VNEKLEGSQEIENRLKNQRIKILKKIEVTLVMKS